MSAWIRLWMGCIFGALLVLLINPVARNYVLAGLFPLRESEVLKKTTLFSENVTEIGYATDSLQLSYLIQIVSEQTLRRKPITRDQREKLIKILREKSEADPRNSLWRQFLTSLEMQESPLLAKKTWILGAEQGSWNDFQSSRFLKVLQQVEAEYGYKMAWQASAISLHRSIATQQVIQKTAREIVSHSPSLDVRLATVKHGIMLTNSSRSIEGGAIGIAIIYIGASGESTPIIGSPGLREKYRKKFLRDLGEAGMIEEREKLLKNFREIESWSRLVQNESNRERRWQHHFNTIFISSLPGAMILSSLFGFLIYGVGIVFTKFEKQTDRVLDMPIAPILGLILGLIVFALTGLFWLTMWGVLSISFFMIRSNKIRSNPPNGLSGWHRGLVIFIGMLLVFPITAFFIGLSPAGRVLMPALGIPIQFGAGSAFFLGLSIFLLSFAAFTAALWGLIDRRSPIPLLQVIHRELGLNFAGVMLTLAVIATPICLFLDRDSAELSSRFMQNEPNVYFSR